LLEVSIEMSSPDHDEVAARQIPVAHQRIAAGSRRNKVVPKERPSERRLTASIAPRPNRDERDPYADVPCTD
jgi:hypothetical protein